MLKSFLISTILCNAYQMYVQWVFPLLRKSMKFDMSEMQSNFRIEPIRVKIKFSLQSLVQTSNIKYNGNPLKSFSAETCRLTDSASSVCCHFVCIEQRIERNFPGQWGQPMRILIQDTCFPGGDLNRGHPKYDVGEIKIFNCFRHSLH
jgi:hypothetical protein